MIKFFRKIRQRLLTENKFSKYLIYAVGEIILVVIGILIALQINNWNQERFDNIELDGLLRSISSSVQSDIKDLNLLSTARKNMGEKTNKIFSEFITSNKTNLSLEEVTYIGLAFQDINNLISFRANLSTFESLTNSTYNKKIQNTDFASLLNAYYTNAKKIKETEDRYNEAVEQRNQEWFAKFRDNSTDQEVFLRPWNLYESFSTFESRYLEILRDISSRNVIGSGAFEPFLISRYDEQLLMGKAIIKMIENSETSFDEQTKLDFSGILYSFANADVVSILINGKRPTGFALKIASSGIIDNYSSNEVDHLKIKYPENKLAWASPYFEVSALGGRVNEMDFSGYSKLILEMKGAEGGETFNIAMKDQNDPTDGSEARVKIELTNQWETYEIDISKFTTANLEIINVPLALIFEGSEGRTIMIKTIQFNKN